MRGIDFSLRGPILACAILLLLANAFPAAGETPPYARLPENVQLAAIPRTILKQPQYQTETPGYCLLVFGREAKTRVWLVADGDQVYIDRNGNGDLTEAGERVVEREGAAFKLGEVTEADGKTRHTRLRLRIMEDSTFRFWIRTSDDHSRFVGRFGPIKPRLAAQPADAPILHPNGPITLVPYPPMSFVRRDSQQGGLSLAAGIPGLGPGTFSLVYAMPGIYSKGIYTMRSRRVLAEIEFPSRTAGGPPIVSKQSLLTAGSNTESFVAGPVKVPPEAGGGYAKMTLTLQERSPGETTPGTLQALVLGDEADLPAVRAAASEAVPMLLAELQSKRWMPVGAIAALTQFGPVAKEAAPALTEALESSDYQTRIHAARALIQILPADEVVPLFAQRLQYEDMDIASNAAHALGLLGPEAKDAADALIHCLHQKRCEYETCHALARIGAASKAVIPALTVALTSDSESVCCSAAVALGEIGPEAASAIPTLILVLNAGNSDLIRSRVAEALGRMGPAAKDAIPLLTKFATAPRRDNEDRNASDLRDNSAKALTLIRPSNDIPRT